MNQHLSADTIGLSDGSKNQDRDALSQRLVAPDEPMILAVIHSMVTRKLTVKFWRAVLQHRVNRRTQWYFSGSSDGMFVSTGYNRQVMWRAPDEPTSGKSIAAVHLTL
jgi:hypothetical protein